MAVNDLYFPLAEMTARDGAAPTRWHADSRANDKGPATITVTGPKACAPGGIRTPDPKIRRLLLYPLSYWGWAQSSVALR